MKLKVICSFALSCLLLGNFALAQRYSTSSKAAIKLYEKANEMLSNRLYDDAIETLEKAIKKDEKFTDAHYRLGSTYLLFLEKDAAFTHFEKTIALAPDNPRYKESYFLVAKEYLRRGEYTKAKATSEKYLSLSPLPKNKAIINKVLVDCNYALANINNKIILNSQALPAPLNQFFHQYFPSLNGDQEMIIFTVRKDPLPGPRPGTYVMNQEDLYVSFKNDGAWTLPQSISEEINTMDNEGTATLSSDGKVLVFTSNGYPTQSANRLKSLDSYGSTDLYISRKTANGWSRPRNLGPKVNSTGWDSHPSLSADGRTLYFSSSRRGGKGASDIWVTYLQEDGEWSTPENVKAINTVMDDYAPFIHPNGKTLFFSTEGLPGFGGYDIYQSSKVNKKWTKPENLGYPLNTQDDQTSLFISADGLKGYYTIENIEPSTNYRRTRLHIFDVPESMRPKYKSNYVKGYVYDSKTNQRLEAKIDLFDLTDEVKQASVRSDQANGDFLIVLNEGSEYALEISKKGYAFKSLTFNYTEGKNIEPLEINIPLDPINTGTVFRLNNIFFDYNQYTLKDKSKAELDELVKFMKENPDVKGEISGHTDNTGDARANETLSLNRAKAVYDYLIKAGIQAGRLSYKGYGSSQPSASNDTEAGRAQNRRIEFKIL